MKVNQGIYYVIRIWDDSAKKQWKFYSKVKREKYTFSDKVKDAEKYVKKAWAIKCKEKIEQSYSNRLFFDGIKAEVVTMYE